MSKSTVDKSKAELPLDALMLECVKDRYKVPYAALRWAKEIKTKENLPEAIQFILPRVSRLPKLGASKCCRALRPPIPAVVSWLPRR